MSHTAAPALADKPLTGALLLLAGALVFACMDATTKYLSATYPVPFVVALRYVIHCLLMAAVLTPLHGRRLVQTRRTGLVLVRASCLAIASIFFALALKRMPVAEASAILFLSPMLVVLLAGPLLQEKAGPLGWLAALTGFAGVLLIARPGSGLDFTGVLLTLAASFLTAFYQLLSRLLAPTESTLALLFYTALVGAVAYGATLPWYLPEAAPPTSVQLGLFLGIGIAGGIGHYCLTKAYTYAAASVLAPLHYAQVVFAGVLGWLVFSHIPDRYAFAGMGVVAASGGIIAIKSRLAQRALARAAET